MNYREVELVAPVDLGPTGVQTWDVTVNEVISGIVLLWDCTIVTVALMIGTLAKCISKVELIDGSDVITSLSGEQIQALCFYTQKYLPETELTVVVGEHARCAMPIYFGRYLFDPELGLDPTKFKNLQIRVTWDEDAANTGVVVNQLTIRGMVFDEKVVTPKGFLMAKEIKSWTPVIAGYEYTDMPLDFNYRLLLIQQKSTTQSPITGLAQLKLSESNDKRIPIDMTGQEIFSVFACPKGSIEERVTLSNTAALQTIHGVCSHRQAAAVEWNANIIAAADDFMAATFAANIMTVPLPVLFTPAKAIISGYVPHFALPIEFGLQDDILDWYDVTRAKSLKLITQGGAAVGTTPQALLVLQQLRTY